MERPRDCTDLFEYLSDRPILSEQEARKIFQELLDAVVFLDKLGIVHHDLKSENILLDLSNGGTVKLIDFGLACHVTSQPITDFFGK